MLKRKCTLPQYNNDGFINKKYKKSGSNRNKGLSQIISCSPIVELNQKEQMESQLKRQLDRQKKQDQQYQNHYIQKIIKKNIYTLDFFNKSINKQMQITSLKNAKAKLIKKSIFQKYKLMNSFNGTYQTALPQLAQQFKQINHQNYQRLSTIKKIIDKKDNINEVNNKNKCIKYRLPRNSAHNKYYQSKIKDFSCLQEISEEKSPKKFIKMKNKENCLNSTHLSYFEIKKIIEKKDAFQNQRLKCLQIEKECLKMQTNKQEEINKIDYFGFYCEEMKTMLRRNTHKIQKIKQLQL